jgi:hypothetical protein
LEQAPQPVPQYGEMDGHSHAQIHQETSCLERQGCLPPKKEHTIIALTLQNYDA